ncbi:MAG: HAD family hydrolase [Ignavibacteriaceae bacterium]|nr:HAD family hydrolase [Ignavibacterium sp.]MCC6256174.1 HAD family hydrolase [Ignavibacteriaceae bacterium]HRQ54918.1 HAD family hydrolase [Ignavibacteriaceae bacterium]
MLNKAVFLDRDGTLNHDSGYLGNPNDLKLFPDTGRVLSDLKNKFHFKLIVISNQSGIARGLITEEQVKSVNAELNKKLLNFDVQIDAFFYCPFHPDFSSADECNCRKPSPKMILDSAKLFTIDPTKSYFIGDSVSDIQAGIAAKLKTILVKTGYGAESISILQKRNYFPSFVAENLTDAYNFIINDSTE